MLFLDRFYKVFPEFLTMDTYIAGESYAGQYIPYFANAVLDSSLHIPLKGAAIGNGWMDGKHQYPGFLQYGVKHGLIEENSEAWKRAKKTTDDCMAELDGTYKDSNPISTDRCEQVLFSVLASRERVVNGTKYCTNIYDVRLEDESPACGMNWPPELKEVTPYLARPDVVQALHATAKQKAWQECQPQVHLALTARHSPSAVTLMPKILSKIELMLFVGDQDFICNYMGVENMIKNLEWNGATGLGVSYSIKEGDQS
jgi:carboxypeptidase D